jgi:di/tricarboxylate transporter
MPSEPTIVLLTLIGSLVLFVTDALRFDLVAVLVVVVLASTGCLEPDEAFAGFASPAVVLVASMYAFAAAVSRSGITEQICDRMIGPDGGGEGRLAFRLVVLTGLLSSVLSNAAVVATLIPVLGTISKETKIPISRLLMPMAFGSLMGGMLTVIGTSKNIALNGVIEQHGSDPFGLFDFSLYGLVLLVIGALYFLGPGRALLPRRRLEETLTEHYEVPSFVTEALVSPSSELVGRRVGQLESLGTHGVSLIGIVRDEEGGTVLAPGPTNVIRLDDVLMLQGDPDAILAFQKAFDLKPREAVKVGDVVLAADDVQLVEAVVPSTSTLVGSTLREADFRAMSGLNVLGISKHGDVQPTLVADTPLEVGDALLVQGHERDLDRLHRTRELIVLGRHRRGKASGKAWTTVALLTAVLLVGGLTPIHISVAALAGAIGLIFCRCVRPIEVRAAVDPSVLVLIGGMLALGRAFEKHGLGENVAEWMTGMGNSFSAPLLLTGILLAATVALTQMVNHVAAAVIMAPVAMSLAEQIGVSDRAFLMAVLTGAEFAFMSPVAHQANAMIMGPGDYRYRDFLRAGTPLTLLLGVVATFLIPVFWPFS